MPERSDSRDSARNRVKISAPTSTARRNQIKFCSFLITRANLVLKSALRADEKDWITRQIRHVSLMESLIA